MYQDTSFGEQLRQWRQRRRISQLDLAVEADLSTRHLSFVETGRSKPSRELVMRLAEVLELPLRSRNALLLSAGYAPTYPERPFDNAELVGSTAVPDLPARSTTTAVARRTVTFGLAAAFMMPARRAW